MERVSDSQCSCAILAYGALAVCVLALHPRFAPAARDACAQDALGSRFALSRDRFNVSLWRIFRNVCTLSGKLDHGFFAALVQLGAPANMGRRYCGNLTTSFLLSLRISFVVQCSVPVCSHHECTCLFFARASYSAETLSQGPKADGDAVEQSIEHSCERSCFLCVIMSCHVRSGQVMSCRCFKKDFALSQ